MLQRLARSRRRTEPSATERAEMPPVLDERSGRIGSSFDLDEWSVRIGSSFDLDEWSVRIGSGFASAILVGLRVPVRPAVGNTLPTRGRTTRDGQPRLRRPTPTLPLRSRRAGADSSICTSRA